MHSERATSKSLSVAVVLFALACVLLLHGAVPFVAMPTLGQAVWSAGFAQSFANQSALAIHAINFGAPAPAAIAFGLSGIYPMSLLMRLGLHPADAYSMMVALWLCLAFFGAWRLARDWGASSLTATAGATLWLSMPIVWGHSGYSMLSLGIALLPLYFRCALTVLAFDPRQSVLEAWLARLALALCCVVAVFMDGYTFVMLAAGSGLLWANRFARHAADRRRLLQIVLPTLACALGIAYALYVAYVGRRDFAAIPIEAFRGWGVDLTFLAIPTTGMHWLFDKLGWSEQRSVRHLFGDASVWVTTFCMPLIVAALCALLSTRHRNDLSKGLFIVACFAFYMALGPSLKIDSQKPAAVASMQVMPAEYALAPTGNAWISEKLPGFNTMRAAYRWTALGVFSLWAILMLWASQARRGHARRPWWVLIALIVMNVPHVKSNWIDQTSARSMFFSIDSDLLAELRTTLVPREKVAFVPYSNDFLVNYLAAAIDVRAYNIGGDKNLEVARESWPHNMKALPFNQLDNGAPNDIAKLLLDGEADVVVLPYFDALWAAHYYPCLRDARTPMSLRTREVIAEGSQFKRCPPEIRQGMSSLREALREVPELELQDGRFHATVRLAKQPRSWFDREALKAQYLSSLSYPIAMSTRNPQVERVLRTGWWALEENHVWSMGTAEIELAAPASRCAHRACSAVLKFAVFGAQAASPIEVKFSVVAPTPARAVTVVATDEREYKVSIPMVSDTLSQTIRIEVPDARSPPRPPGSPDTPPLGISLFSIDMALQDRP